MIPSNCKNIYALTVKQPWASLIINGYKTVENRSWRAPEHLIGKRLAIHAGKKFDPEAIIHDKVLHTLRKIPHPLPQGFLLGTVLVTGIINPDGSPQAPSTLDIQSDLSWWIPGSIGWILREPSMLKKPVPMRGKLGLWPLK